MLKETCMERKKLVDIPTIEYSNAMEDRLHESPLYIEATRSIQDTALAGMKTTCQNRPLTREKVKEEKVSFVLIPVYCICVTL